MTDPSPSDWGTCCSSSSSQRARPRDEQALPAAELTAALAVPVPDGSPEGTWFAVGEGRVLATGPTPGQARRAAGRQAPEVPVVIRMV
ncbi:hypothetical protein [Streptomyces xanthochromogenes]|uniref:hypothetical protein n=1 Tax=Streptomyces xanthochromogenes TaxID=67384 RepID=UPI00382F74BC